MRWWSLFVAVIVVLASLAPLPPGPSAPRRGRDHDGAGAAGGGAQAGPVTAHGFERIDDYAWLRDPNWREVMRDASRLAPEIRAYLEAENAYAESILAPLAGLRAKLVGELKGRIEQDEFRRPAARRSIRLLAQVRPWRRAPADRAGAARRRRRASSARRTRPGGGKILFLISANTTTARTTAATPTRSTRPAPRASPCACATSPRGATCRTPFPRSRPSRGRRTAAPCSTSGSTPTIARASCTATVSEATRQTTIWSTRRRISASRSRSIGRRAAASW